MGVSKSLVWKIVSLATFAVVTAGLIVGDSILSRNENNINQILCPPIVNTKQLEISQEKGQEMSKQIVQEGAVLLKNNGNILPFGKKVDSVNVFGWSSVDWAYGANSGSCSGRVMAENNKAEELIDLYDSLEMYGIEYNTELKEYYTKYFTPYVYALKDPGSVNNNNVVTLHEPNIDDYPKEVLDNAYDYSPTALVVITRNAGEDIPADRQMNKGGAGATNESSKIYLDLSCEEEAMLKYVGDNYVNVVVIINCPVAMDLAFLNEIEGLDAAIQVGFTGTHGAEVIAPMLWGEMTPSGHLVDTYAYDRNTSFAMKSKNGAKWSSGGNGKQFFEYIENIYVGYKWYETADSVDYWKDYSRKILDDRDRDLEVEGFDAVVQYPFGYGLSYTTFDWEVVDSFLTDKDGGKVEEIDPMGDLNLQVRVHNNGEHAGKDVVEVYLTAPYYENEIEKSFVNLVGYEKTDLLEPDESEIIDIKVSIYDCLSYDCYDKNNNSHKGYELDRGLYQFKLMTDSHNIKKVNFTNGAKNVDGIIEFNVAETLDVEEDKYTGEEVGNLFTGDDAIDGYPIDAVEGGYAPQYLSRANFPDIKSYTGNKSRASTQKLEDAYKFTQQKGNEWDNATVDKFGNPTFNDDVKWGVNHNITIYEKGKGVTDDGYQLGEDYDDPLWDEALEQITVSECLNLINNSYGTPEIKSVGKPSCPELDGPAQIKCYYQSAPRGTGYPSAVVIAQTWNKQLCEDFGLSYAADMTSVSISGLWGWGCNIHRTPVGGRNWEYFSEDPFISGTVLAAAVRGLNNGGRYGYIKHFCMNESETNKVEGFTFTTEQALREVYLKPFQKGIQEGGALGVMTSFNRIGAVYSGGSEAAISGVMRTEWGFRGSIITDWANNNGYMCIDHQVRSGGDLGMNCSLNASPGLNFQYNENGTKRLQHQMKEVCHHVLYTYLRSQYLNKVYNENPQAQYKVVSSDVIQSWKWWKTAVIDLNVALIGGAALFVLMTFLPGKKKKEIEG